MKSNNKKKNIIIGSIVGLLLLIVGVSYGFFVFSGKQDKFITFRAGACLSITITEESDAISLANIYPVTIEEGLTYTPYTFTIKNNCDNIAPYQISLESLDLQDNTLSGDYLRVSLEDSEGRINTNILSSLNEAERTIDNSYDSRLLYSGVLNNNGTTSFKLRMWLDYEATKEQAASKVYKSKIAVSARSDEQLTDEIFTINYTEKSKEEGVNGYYNSYSTTVNISDKKDNNLTAKYCVSSERCIPDTNVELTNNSFDYTYNNGNNILCTQAKDSIGNQSIIACNKEIKIDTEAPSISYELADNTPGENNYYKALQIKLVGNDSGSGVSKIKYCTTTEDACEPTIETTNNQVITLNSGNNQKICSKVIDNNNNESSVTCSSTYNVDGVSPVINTFYIGGSSNPSSITSTSTSIYITFSDSDVAAYCIKTNNSSSGCTWNTASSSPINKSYTLSGTGTKTLYAFIKDKAGNISAVKSDSVTVLTAKNQILANNTIDTSRSSGKFTTAFVANTAGKIFSGTDDDGTTYFFAGVEPNNWVQFAGYYWRIIRINGDGSIRLIFNGTSNTIVGRIETAFNTASRDNAYVGYMYGTPGSNNYNDTHKNTNSSTVKIALDDWFENNIANNSTYLSKIDTNAGFCGDRQIVTGTFGDVQYNGNGTLEQLTYYASEYRSTTLFTPTFKCTNKANDLYTVSSSNKGNKALTYPVGLITIDEVYYAIGYGTKRERWLCNGYFKEWTMSPSSYTNAAIVIYMQGNGNHGATGVNEKEDMGARPVINLKADIGFSSGNGTSSNPYVVS